MFRSKVIDDAGLPDVERLAIECFMREQVSFMRETSSATIIVMQMLPRDRTTFGLLLP